MLERWGHLVARRPRTVLAASLIVVILAAGYGATLFSHLSDGGFEDPASESARAQTVERETFGNLSADVIALYSSDELTASDPAFQDAVTDVVRSLDDEAVVSVTPYYETPPEAGLTSKDGHTAQVIISLTGSNDDEFIESYRDIQDDLQADGLTTDISGKYAVFDDVNEHTSKDLKRAELLSMPLVIILALIIFGSAVAAGMPAMVGVVAMGGAIGAVRLISEFTDVSIFSINVISLLGIGLAIDYALFMISRFREELVATNRGDPDGVARATVTTMQTAGRTVMFSGLTVAASLISLLVFPQMFLKSMGYGGVAAVVVAMLAALTLLPAVMQLLGHRIEKGKMPWRKNSAAEVEHGRWAQFAHAVMKRPILVIVGTVAVLLFIASPFLTVTWGSVDHRVLPEEAASYQASEKLFEEFGGETSSARLMLQGVDPSAVEDYTANVAAVDGVESVEPVADGQDATLLTANWSGTSQSTESQDIVRAIRDVEPTQGEALVGGLTAETVDLTQSVAHHLPYMGLIVFVVMMVLLFLAFGSLVLPLKAIVMNFFSITASFGVVTWIFADGHLTGLLNFNAPGFLDVTNPIVMLAVLFGLSMDYEVFLLSRVREEWDRTGDNDRAVAAGVQKTGRIITSAAVLLAVVIGAFSTSGVVFIKLIGVGMLVALLLDATVVRMLLVPATMKLLGKYNWWAPGPMRRWWEKYGFREG